MAEIRVLADRAAVTDLYSSSAEELEKILNTALGGRDNSAVQAFISIYGENPPPRQYPQELPIEITLREIFRNQLRNDRVFIMPILAPLDEKSGGASVKMFRPVIGKKPVINSEERKIAVSHAVSVTFDRIVVCVRDGRLLYVDPSQMVSVIGLRVLPLCRDDIAGLSPNWPPARDVPSEALDCDLNIFRAVRIAGAVITGSRDIYLREGHTVFASALRQLFSLHIASLAAGQVIRAAHDFASSNYTDLSAKGGTIANYYIAQIQEQPRLYLDAGWPAEENAVAGSPFTTLIDNKIHEFNRAYVLSFYSQLDMYGLLPAYFLAESLGVDDDDVRALIEAGIEREIKRKEKIIDAANKMADRSRLASYLRILQKRLTSKRYNQLPHDSIAALMRSLNKAELSQMEHEYSVEQQFAEAVLNNSCKHVGLYRKLRRTMDYKLQKDILRNLQANYFDKAKTSMMISCRVCKFNIMCPHLVTVIENSDKPIGALRVMLNPYLSKDSTQHQQYCNICGEVLFAAYDLHDDVISQVEQDDDLRRAIWAEISNVLRNVHFEKTVDINRLTANIRDSIYVIASGIAARVDKIQSYSINEILQRKSLYLSILAMAKVLQIMRQYPAMKFRDIGGKASGASDLITTAANIIYITKIVAIREIPGITKDSIKDILRQTSALLLPERTKLKDTASEPEKDYYMLVYYDPTYHWLARANKLPPSAFAGIMGGTIAQLLKRPGWIYSGAKIPRRAFDDPAEEKAFQLWMKVATGGGPEIYARVGSTLARSPEFNAHNEQWAEIAQLEKKSRRAVIERAMRCWSQTGIKGENKFTRREVKLGELFDENGLPHKWDIYLAGRSEYTKAEILQKPDAVITDRLCSVCRVKESQAAKLDERRIEAAIDLQNSVSGFFKFYDRRCPESTVHSWDKSGFICEKCELDLRWDNEKRTSYYLRYKDVYMAEKDKLIDSQTAAPPAKAVRASPAPGARPEWKENFQFVTDLAKVSGVSVGQIQSIGAYEGVELDDIINGKYVPTVTENKNNTRPAHVKSVVEATLISWEKVRNYVDLRDKSEYLTLLINGYNRSQLTKLPSILHGFANLYAAFKANEDPERTITMCIQEWCERLLRLYNLDDPPSEKLRRQFVVSQVVSTVDLESLLTKREAFNWSIVYGTKTSADEADLNDEFIGEEAEKFDDPFSMDGFDVEDPGEINLRAGSDYGLD